MLNWMIKSSRLKLRIVSNSFQDGVQLAGVGLMTWGNVMKRVHQIFMFGFVVYPTSTKKIRRFFLRYTPRALFSLPEFTITFYSCL